MHFCTSIGTTDEYQEPHVHVHTSNDKTENKLSSIKLPAKMRKRGRPKGAETTVVSLR